MMNRDHVDLLEALRDRNIWVQQADLQGAGRGMTTKYNNGYLVLVDRGLSLDLTIETVKHELAHILLGHLDSDQLQVDEMELQAENYKQHIFFNPSVRIL